VNVLLLRWDTKPDKRIRGTFLRHRSTRQNVFLCRDPCLSRRCESALFRLSEIAAAGPNGLSTGCLREGTVDLARPAAAVPPGHRGSTRVPRSEVEDEPLTADRVRLLAGAAPMNPRMSLALVVASALLTGCGGVEKQSASEDAPANDSPSVSTQPVMDSGKPYPSDPDAIVVLGHSGSTGESSDPDQPGVEVRENSWVTGTTPTSAACTSRYSR